MRMRPARVVPTAQRHKAAGERKVADAGVVDRLPWQCRQWIGGIRRASTGLALWRRQGVVAGQGVTVLLVCVLRRLLRAAQICIGWTAVSVPLSANGSWRTSRRLSGFFGEGIKICCASPCVLHPGCNDTSPVNLCQSFLAVVCACPRLLSVQMYVHGRAFVHMRICTCTCTSCVQSIGFVAMPTPQIGFAFAGHTCFGLVMQLPMGASIALAHHCNGWQADGGMQHSEVGYSKARS